MEYIYETLQVHARYWDDVSWTRKTTLACLVFELSALALVPYSKPCVGHNSLTVWNIFMNLYRCMHDIETMCHEKARQNLACLVFELSTLDLVPYSKPCVGHNSKTIWNISMKICRCMHDIEAMCNEHGRQLLLIWFINYLLFTKFHIVNPVWAISTLRITSCCTSHNYICNLFLNGILAGASFSSSI